jgi:hypothetical protein
MVVDGVRLSGKVETASPTKCARTIDGRPASGQRIYPAATTTSTGFFSAIRGVGDDSFGPSDDIPDRNAVVRVDNETTSLAPEFEFNFGPVGFLD